MQSISEDFDIQYQQKDILRALNNRFDDLPAGLFLIKTEDGDYFYGKEFTYALFAAPFYKILGDRGIIFFNALLFYIMMIMAYLILRRKNNELAASCISIIFFMLSTSFVYVFWIHAEIYNMFVLMLGLFLWFQYRIDRNIKYLALASLILGIAAVAKAPNILLYIPMLAFEIYRKRWKNTALMFLAFVTPLLLVYGYFYFKTGAVSFYGGNRLYYVKDFPFIEGFNSLNEAGKKAVSIEDGGLLTIINHNNLGITFFNIFYYFFGRFTGMVWYYPFALLALLSFFSDLKRTKGYIYLQPEKILILLGIVLNIIFFVVIVGNNYLGGAHAIGNRYFYIYPAFIFLLSNVNIKKFSLFLLIAFATVAPINFDPIGNSLSPDGHIFKFPYKYIPIEYSQMNYIPFWSHHNIVEGFDIYRLDDNSKYAGRGFRVQNHSELLIKSYAKMTNLDILAYSPMHENLVYLGNRGSMHNFKLKGHEAKFITISNIEPEYNNQYFIYKILLNCQNDLFIMPIGERKFGKLDYIDGFHGTEDWSGKSTSWMRANAIILINSFENRSGILSMNASSFYRNRTLEVYAGDKLLERAVIHPNSLAEIKTPINLAKGANSVIFHVVEGCERPCDKPELKNSDARCLSVAIQNLTLIEENSSQLKYISGFYNAENWSGIQTRWMQADSTLQISTPANRTATLSSNVQSFYRNRTLEITSGGIPAAKVSIPTSFINLSVPIHLVKGTSFVQFHVSEGCERPCDIDELKSHAKTSLIVAVQNLTVV
jgi:hypothetical protein